MVESSRYKINGKNRENEGNRENNRNTLEIYSGFERARARMETENIKILTERQQPRVVFFCICFLIKYAQELIPS